MRIVSVVGVRKSGKTTTVEVLIRELKKKGYTVGTVKTINCPMFTMEEKNSSNTLRHKRAGADVVVASGRWETAFIHASGLDQNQIFANIDTDFLLLEGDYMSDVPRIICAHTEEEVRERLNPYTFLVSGRIADEMDEVLGIPAISALKNVDNTQEKTEHASGVQEKPKYASSVQEKLNHAALFAEYVIAHVPETTLPVTLSPIPEEAKYFCLHHCKKDCAKTGQEILNEAVNRVGEPAVDGGKQPDDRGKQPENGGKRSENVPGGVDKCADAGKSGRGNHIFLTGERKIGKSTVWQIVFEKLGIIPDGMQTLPIVIGGERRGFYMHSLGAVPEGYINDVPISVQIKDRGMIPITESFDTFGTALICDLIRRNGEGAHAPVLIDELGRMERKSENFRKAIWDLLDSDCRVFGVLQKGEIPFNDRICAREDVEVYEVTNENWETLPEFLIGRISGN